MNVLGQSMPRQRFLRTKALLTLTILLFFVSYHEAIAWKGASTSRALKLLGQFAFAVVSGAATDIASAEVKKRISPEPKKPELEAALRPENPAQSASPPPPPRPELQPIGYKFTISWMGHDSSYTGTLVIRGTSGIFRVTNTRLSYVVDQDIRVEQAAGAIFFVGSNPRYMNSFVPAYYFPDTFRLIQERNGEWKIADTCDTQGVCSPVEVIEASTF
jgi:hypothetical protein